MIAVIAAFGIAQVALAHGEKAGAAPAFDYAKAQPTPFGIAADPRKAKRTIRVGMDDKMRFVPSKIEVRRGEIVRFVAANEGQVLHEMVLGTMEDLKAHAELMKKFPDMEHDEPHMAHVAPGKTGEIGWRFTRPGTFHFGCLVPGHFEAGMVGTITVR
ncbi:MAG TPA: cupredoxin family protein [Burkholderiales bacterium]